MYPSDWRGLAGRDMFAREGHLEMDRHMERRSGTYMHILTNTDWDELRTSVQDG